MKNILVIRFSSIGDIVLITPVFRCLKNQLDNVHITFATKQEYASILKPNPYVDEIISLGDDWQAFKKEVNKKKYDVVLDLHRNLRSLRLRRGLGGKQYKLNKLNFKKYLLVRFKKNLLPEKHIVDRYLETAKKLSIKNDGKGIDFYLPEEIRYTSSFPEQNSFYAYCIGAQFGTKKMPKNKILELSDRIDQPLVLIGGKEDQEVAEWVLSRTKNKQILSFCGKTNLFESALLVQHAKGVFTHDTGMMHIASAFDVPIISIWGNTVPDFGMYPYREKNTALVEQMNLSCRPCSKIGFQKCPKKHFKCMDHDIENILHQVNQMNS